ncbi:lytic murein transglycosylase [Shimia abyssi]|uniref:Lytic murein transglycosylase n=1 Tax=Shimia abyssi TaxID=1662395 RepID=A0A2P8F4B6_9RHOB|nr:lytic murein transglycosylase [Shimia abyssi]PSL16558.1 lytic murein transglycosylase [Shimia abyssi]
MSIPGLTTRWAAIGAILTAVSVEASSPDTSLRPVPRPVAKATVAVKKDTFEEWIVEYRARAIASGIRPSVFDSAFDGAKFDAKVIQRDRNQSEFTKTIWDYLDSATSDLRVSNGRAALHGQSDNLEKIERAYGVDQQVIVAIWGLESAYGTFRGSNSVISSLATLAYDGRRAAFFEEQLTAALTILQSGDVGPKAMTGSWAGAMGHTQFMPTSYLEYAEDFTGDGKRDIWSNDPRDALASTAAYLKAFGWTKGQPWGVEVTLPDGFDYTQARRDSQKMPSAWAQLGVFAMDGQAVPNHGKASVLVPAGAKGAAFLIFDNFEVLEKYNTADAYVIGVGHLGDRIMGGDKFQAEWPREDRALTYNERIELQELLTAQGFDTKKIDGKIGPLTIDAVRQFQKSKGMIPDGYASLSILKLLRS